jgi:16S rRNA (uracil1498-N3)-methyltransferase
MPRSIRLYVEATLHPGAIIAATPEQAHRLATVMRRTRGDPVRLFNGRDGEWQGHVHSIGRGRAELVIDHQLRPQSAEPELWLIFALLKRDATDLVIEKATELGVTDLQPVVTERANTHRVNQARLAAIATEAAEQSERLSVPTVHPPRSLQGLLAAWPLARTLFVAAERADAPPLQHAALPVGLLVGPEGGFSEAELDAIKARPFVTLASLGPRILRAETACIVGLALLQAAEHG